MAKETIIIFLYDTKYVQKEEDDPAKAILYFHPTWASDQQKNALCGQLVGTYTCVKSFLGRPKIMSLQTGKFFMLENGKYILAVGSDRNISDGLLENRANTLNSLIIFFHKDFQTLSTLYKGDSLSAKLYHIFEQYLKMLLLMGNIFSHIPTLSLPKSASNVFMEAVHILECCQQFNNVLGGAMMYHNKVVATQLSADLTKRLILSDPYRIKCPAEIVEVSYELPLGVQLLQVYITNAEYCKLFEESSKNRNIFKNLSNKSMKMNYSKTTQQLPEPHIVSAMKRDQSLLFTAVPEEGSDHNSLASDQPFIPTSKKSRPKFLNLKSVSVDSNSELKASKPGPGTPFCGQRSVCSTPLSELKKFVHMNPLSICKNNDISEEKANSKASKNESVNQEKTAQKNSILKSENAEYVTKTDATANDSIESPSAKVEKNDILLNSAPYLNITSNFQQKKYSSLIDLSDIVNSISKDSLNYFRNKSKTFVDIASPEKKKKHLRSKSITDPTFPVQKQDGAAISRWCYDKCIANDLEVVEKEVEQGSKNKFIPKDVYESDQYSLVKKNNQELKKETDIKPSTSSSKINKEHRKSLTLPLKPLASGTTHDLPETSNINRRYSMGVQLTPLMSKLSMLASEERSSGFCSRDTTPGDCRGMTPTQANLNFPFGKFEANKEEKVNELPDDALQKCVLFVCGQQDIVLMMLLREEACEEPSVIKQLWEVCTEHLTKLQKQLIYCMESQAGAKTQESEPYSFLCLDSEWDTFKRGGPWGTGDLEMLDNIHESFSEVPNLTEMLVRGNDNVIYANRCGPTEVYYHESANPTAGLPPPADPMGSVPLKAKRRLERDHNVVLL